MVNFEEDLANGYLIGELLHRFNQQTDFDLFAPGNSADCKARRSSAEHLVATKALRCTATA